MNSQTTDFLVIGGGIMGIALARLARRRYPDARVLLIEKEPQIGLHASGRNSGVLHAGFYYTADSLKARFTRDGNRAWTEYCTERGLSILRCGKLVVARNEQELPVLDELLARAAHNGVRLEPVTEAEAHAIEPRARTFQRALYALDTASVEPREVVSAMMGEARDLGVETWLGCPFTGRRGNRVQTGRGEVDAGYVINTAGLYADRVAREFGFSSRYRILPFKGLYLLSDRPEQRLRAHIYPVPDLRNPFLGVHATAHVDGTTGLGPTAIPAFWREHYRGLANFDAAELADIVARQAGLFVRNDFGFRALAMRELPRYSRRVMLNEAAQLCAGLGAPGQWRWGEPGIRAQLYDVEERRLEMDFYFEGDDRSFHLLNAVSPAFTCSLPFSEYLFDHIDRHLGSGDTAQPLAETASAG